MKRVQDQSGRLSWPGAAVLIVLLLAAAGIFALYWLETMPFRTAARARSALVDLLHIQPQITVQDRVVFEQSVSALELTVLTRETHIDRDVEREWLGSKKRLELRGDYRVRAGFDLSKPFRVRIEGSHIRLEVPPPRIISIDQIAVEVRRFDNGIWNKFSPDEVVEEVRTLPLLARQKASEAGVQKEALARFTDQLAEKLGPHFQVDVSVDPGQGRPPSSGASPEIAGPRLTPTLAAPSQVSPPAGS